ncbi:DUF6913 domain-containing protein [Maribacter hydrothermalis]|uniref:Uncharacterized protein n=1 Tax=Maribacter hydrothermalis TaxID=1836467 RepID=A0A1B7Z7Z8_9FLAO|nr:hypothetical protein [Maribacter hydrothermalis]APQ19166.1 hypothetical protein BTR34_18375 [Maribacter hydrothermalis]OBR38823.1 hypothetical protein A9200_03910 [Maribacter hydrothermalis]
MFLKGIKDKLKRKSGRKILKQLVLTPVSVARGNKGIRSVGCIVDLDKFEKTEVFYQFQEEFSLHPNAVKIIGYKRYYDKNSPYATPVFSDKDLGWKGEIENSYALEFLGREYDLLVNYYEEDNLLLNLLSLKTKARLKVGFKDVGPTYNDLMIDTPLNDFMVFKKELKKYLGIFKEI